MAVARAGGKGRAELVFNGVRVSVLQDEKTSVDGLFYIVSFLKVHSCYSMCPNFLLFKD